MKAVTTGHVRRCGLIAAVVIAMRALHAPCRWDRLPVSSLFLALLGTLASAGEPALLRQSDIAPPLTASDSTACLETTGKRILAAALAEQDARFLAFPPDHDFGYVPDPGQRRELVLTLGSPLGTAQNVCVRRKEQMLDREQLRRSVQLSLDGLRQATDISFEILSWVETSVPVGRLDLPLRGALPSARGSQEVIWRGSVYYEQDRSVAIWVKLRLQRKSPCLRSVNAMRRGTVIAEAPLRETPCDAGAILADASTSPRPAESHRAHSILSGGSVLARDLPAGAWLLPAHVAQVATRRRGEQTTLRVVSGGVCLEIPVELEQSASAGERVWVRRVPDRRRLHATVLASGQLELVVPEVSRASQARGQSPISVAQQANRQVVASGVAPTNSGN